MRLASALASLLLVASVASCAARAPATDATLTNRPAQAGAQQAELELRVRALEAKLAEYDEALQFLNKVYAQQKAGAGAGAADDELDPNAIYAVDISHDIKAGKIDGPAKAPVTIVKVFDFTCPYCYRMASVLDDVVKAYKGQVRAVYVDLIIHPQTASVAHHAACAAGKQGKYVAFKHAVWEKGFAKYMDTRDASAMSEASILQIAKDVGLDTKRLAQDMGGTACRELIDADQAEMSKFKVNATPTMFINGKVIAGAVPVDALKKLVDEQLAIVKASGAGADYYDKVVLATGQKQFTPAK